MLSKKQLLSTFIFLTFCHANLLQAHGETTSSKDTYGAIEEPGAVSFVPPKDWRFADSKELSSSVKVMVIGGGEGEYPPSMNLATEKFAGSLRDYLKIVKNLNSSQGTELKDLGKISTEAGNASLSQVDIKTEWGPVRLMHVIMVKSGTAYILTAAAKKDEFPKYYKEFFASMKSLKINKDDIEMVGSKKKRDELEGTYQKLKDDWMKFLGDRKPSQQLFDHPDFHLKYWHPFEDYITLQYNEMGNKWKSHMLKKAEIELLEMQKPIAEKSGT